MNSVDIAATAASGLPASTADPSGSNQQTVYVPAWAGGVRRSRVRRAVRARVSCLGMVRPRRVVVMDLRIQGRSGRRVGGWRPGCWELGRWVPAVGRRR